MLKENNSLPIHCTCNKDCPQRKAKGTDKLEESESIGIQWNPKMALDFGRSP